MRAAFWALFALLLIVRLPTLVEPAGADQDLYAYVGQAIGRGGVPYQDAWDQKPPAIHYTYAAMYAIWPYPSVVPATDLVVAALTALGLIALGRRLAPQSWTGELAAALYLIAGHPALTRLGGIRVRAQCEVFIALAVTLACVLAARRAVFGAAHPASPPFPPRPQTPVAPSAARTASLVQPHGNGAWGGLELWRWLAAGALVGLAITYKYNAAAYLLPLTALAWAEYGSPWTTARTRLAAASVLGGAAAVVVAMLAWFGAHRALGDLLAATIRYNLEYSGETYQGLGDALAYLLTFPIRHARIDALWFLGGAGCLVLLLALRRHPRVLVWLLWVGAACLSIAINGSRGLPQYFVQAQPALALAGGLALTWVRPTLRLPGSLILWTALAVGAWRVGTFPKIAEYLEHDWQYVTGRLSVEQHLARFGARDSDDKYSALAVSELAAYLAAETPADAPVLVFGFSPGALVQARRESASRFFWSRPVIVGFNAGNPAYATRGLLADLERRPPTAIALQRRDWDDTIDSAGFFLNDPHLRAWLDAHYVAAGELGNFLLWRPR